ncbi:MAG: prepilin-type N-terminal cleavage/methylation domain-containing protein [Gemmatimonadetes bacterium]|nr:prepilin-type N-terminal cleavage/methylation domain-containing protein [Gemmatimonadota bacterium]
MRRGFSLLELLVALVLLEVGVLATVGMLFLAQQNFRRADLTLRGVLESQWIADSLAFSGSGGSGSLNYPWGGVFWAPTSDPIGGILVTASSQGRADTTAWAFAPERAAFPPLSWPDSSTGPREP